MQYMDFLEKYGYKTKYSDDNGVLVLSYQDAKHALEIIENEKKVVWGGEIYSINSNNAIDHAFIVLGDSYHCLDWSYDEQSDDDIRNSIALAYDSINNAKEAINNAIYIELVL